jgi:linoleoyl-CoA desaturase
MFHARVTDKAGDAAAGIAEDEAPVYRWAEINRHNRKRDCWIVIDGAVYDVTRWVDAHPGGDIICSMAGEDVSALFHSSHFRDVSAWLNAYRIGIAETPGDSLVVASPFLTTLKSRVYRHFVTNKVDYRRTRILTSQVVVSILAFCCAWVAVFALHIYPLVVAMGLISCAMVGGFAHEYCHSTLIAEGNKINAPSLLCSVIWAVICPFMLEKHFQYEHLSHHRFPMNEDFDYEVFALRRVLRLDRSIPHKRMFEYQQYYAPLVYAFYITTQVVVGFTSRFFARRKLSRDGAFWFHIYVLPAITILVHVAAPIYLVGLYAWIACFVLYNAVWQLSTYTVAAVVHMTGYEASESRDWSAIVCARSVNVLCGNRLYDWLSGGFNYQIEHHLLPTIARENLPRIASIVRETCREFGYPYREYRSFAQYWGDHYSYLAELGRARP